MIRLFDENEIITKLSEYAVSLQKNVFVVGGAVRDYLLQKKTCCVMDIDLAGELSLEEMMKFLELMGVQNINIKNKKLQVLSFSTDDKTNYEYARMRREKYHKKDSHTPSEVEFVSKVEEDAKRRDFTVNSVYYDRHSSALIDPVGGIQDLKEKVVRPVLGEATFMVDPARIVRFVELVARFQLHVNDEVLDWVKKYAPNVLKLNHERLKKEVNRLVCCEKYEDENGEYLERVEKLLDELKLQKVIK